MAEKQEIQLLTESREKQRKYGMSGMIKAAGAALIMTGAAGIFFVLGGSPVFRMPVFAAVGAVVIIMGLDFVGKGRLYGTFLCLIAAAAVFAMYSDSVVRGLYAWGNHVRSVWNEVFGTYYEAFAMPEYTEMDILMAGIVLVLLGFVAVCGMMRGRRIVLLTVTVFAPLCLCLTLSAGIPVWVCAALITGWIVAWCGISGPGRLKWDTLFLAVAVTAAGYFLFPADSGILWQRLAFGFRTNISQGIEKIRFGEDTLPKGDLRKADRMLSGEEERLELEMENVLPIYLRGFVGSKYERNAWKHFSAEAYGGEYTGMLSWLDGQGLSPGEQYAEYQNASSAQDSAGVEVSVRNVGADRRYVYLPETASGCTEGAGEWEQDWSMESSGLFGRKEYGFTYYNTQSNAELQMPDEWIYQAAQEERAEKFRQAETVYRSFVYDKYLELDEDQKEELELLFFNGDTGSETDGLYSVTSRIRTVLRILTDYRENPEQMPADRDFLSWFLEEGKQGNAAYYATAAVLAYRAAGIPARYAEGYVLTREQAGKTEGNTAILTGKNAHAWAEVYVDGMGWRTIEVTPGFYEEAYDAEVIIAIPDEEIEGTNGDTARIPSSEAYEYPETEEEEPEPVQEENNPAQLLILFVISIAALLESIRLARCLYRDYQYGRMSRKEKMYFLYCEIMGMMRKMYKDFNSDHPFEIPGVDDVSFDTELYERTVKRMERIIYGEEEPAPREIPAAEALARQVWEAARGSGRWGRRILWRYIHSFCGQSGV